MYYYFCASLPDVSPGVRATLTLKEFDRRFREWASPADYDYVTGFAWPEAPGEVPAEYRGIYADFYRFEVALRLGIARRRANKLGIVNEYPEPEVLEVQRILAAASAAGDPAKREEVLNQARWQYIEEQTQLHEFDLDAVCAYRLRLQILWSKDGQRIENGRTNFREAMTEIMAEAGCESNIAALN